MKTKTKTMTLLEFCGQCKWPVLWWGSTGTLGDYSLLNDPDFDFADRNELMQLTGTIENREWVWDGEGDPTDDRANTILRLKAYDNKKQWNQIYKEWSEG